MMLSRKKTLKKECDQGWGQLKLNFKILKLLNEEFVFYTSAQRHGTRKQGRQNKNKTN